jgi:hypothetical protein
MLQFSFLFITPLNALPYFLTYFPSRLLQLAGILEAGCLAVSADQVIYFWGRPAKPAPFFSINPFQSGDEEDKPLYPETPKEVLA